MATLHLQPCLWVCVHDVHIKSHKWLSVASSETTHTHTHTGTHNCVFYTDLFCCQIFSCCIILRSLIKMRNKAKSFHFPLETYCNFLCIQKSPVIQSGIKCNIEGKRRLTVWEKVMTVRPADSHIFFIADTWICVCVCLLVCVCVSADSPACESMTWDIDHSDSGTDTKDKFLADQ